MKKDFMEKDFMEKVFTKRNCIKRKCAVLLCLSLALFVSACTGKGASGQDSIDSMEEKEAKLREALQEVLDGQTAADDADLAPSAFMTAEGEPGYQFKGQETMEFTNRLSYDGRYFLSFAVWGDDGAQVEINSDALGIKKETVGVTSDGKGVWKLLELSAGEYTFTARSLSGGNCSVLAMIGLVEELPELSDTLTVENGFPCTYLCKVPEDISLDYTFLRDGREDTYGPMAVFYNAKSHEEIGTISLEAGTSEVKGSIDIPAGDILIRVNTSDWSIAFH